MLSKSLPAKTLIADDHPTIARLLGDFLSTQPDVVLAGIVHTGPAVLEFCANNPVDFLILDLGLPGMSGLEVLETLKKEFPNIRTLVFSALSTEKVIRLALELGARGFLEKSAAFEEVADGVARVIAGETFMGPAVRTTIIRMMSKRDDHPSLTNEEIKFLRRINQGMPSKEIAKEFNISLSGAYKIIDRIKAKLGARTPADLIFAGMQYGITIAPEELNKHGTA